MWPLQYSLVAAYRSFHGDKTANQNYSPQSVTTEEIEMINNTSTKLVSVIGITLFAGAAQAAYQDIAINGGFENGDFTGWALFPGSLGPAGQQISSTNPSSGLYSGRLTETAAAANIIKQANLLGNCCCWRCSICRSILRTQRWRRFQRGNSWRRPAVPKCKSRCVDHL